MRKKVIAPKKQLGGVKPQIAQPANVPGTHPGMPVVGFSVEQGLGYAAHYLAVCVCETTQHDRGGNVIPCGPCVAQALVEVQKAYGPLCARTKAIRPQITHPGLAAAERALMAEFPQELKDPDDHLPF